MSATPAHPLHEGEATVRIDDRDAIVEGLPGLAELPLANAILLQGTVAADLLLRTVVASIVSVPLLSWGLSVDMREEREQLDFYRELTRDHDVSRSFPPPSARVRVEATSTGGDAELLRFDSPFTSVNPALRDSYARFSHNGTAWAQHWRHGDRPRPTLCVIHGFMASPFWLNSAFFSLPYFFEQGYDLLLYVLPFHGQRRSPLAPFSGWGYFAHGVAHLHEAMAHAVHDFRLFVDYLESSGVEQVGVTGVSLGGYTAALLAAVEPRLKVAIPNCPVTSMGPMIADWFPANILVDLMHRIAGESREGVDEALRSHSPLTYEPLLPADRLMIIGGLGDRLAPPRQSAWLWEHWQHPRLHWFPGNHTLHVNRGAYQQEMRAFMRGVDFCV